MYGLIHRHKTIVAIIIAIASVAFLFWMFSAADIKEMAGGSKACIATVNGECITLREYRIELLRTPLPENSPEARRQVAETLVIREMLYQKARNIGLFTSDKEIIEIISSDPAFQENGKFSPDRYKSMLAALNILPEEYEEYLRKILTVNKLIDLIGNGIYITEEEEDMHIKLQSTVIDGKAYRININTVNLDYKPSEEEIIKFYEENKDMFTEKEKVIVKLWTTKDKKEASNIYLKIKEGEEPEGFELIEEKDFAKLPDRIRKKLDDKDYKYDLRKVGNTFYIVKILREEKGRIKPLEEVKEEVIKELIKEKSEELLKTKAEEVLNKLKNGNKVNVPYFDLSDSSVNQLRFLFNVDEKTLVNILNANEKVFGPFKSGNTYFVLYIESIRSKALKEDEIEKIKQDLFLIKRSAMLDLLIKSLRERTDIEFNTEILS